jgi:hypothetical protein
VKEEWVRSLESASGSVSGSGSGSGSVPSSQAGPSQLLQECCREEWLWFRTSAAFSLTSLPDEGYNCFDEDGESEMEPKMDTENAEAHRKAEVMAVLQRAHVEQARCLNSISSQLASLRAKVRSREENRSAVISVARQLLKLSKSAVFT